MPPADPSSATTATPIVAMPMSRRWPPLDILDRPLRGFCEASVDRHRFRCAGWKREANSDDGSTAQDSAHHRAAVELIHLARSPNIELPVQCRPAYRERSRRASGPPCVAPSRRRGVASSPARQGRPFDRPFCKWRASSQSAPRTHKVFRKRPISTIQCRPFSRSGYSSTFLDSVRIDTASYDVVRCWSAVAIRVRRSRRHTAKRRADDPPSD
jgi:hypothetical protein